MSNQNNKLQNSENKNDYLVIIFVLIGFLHPIIQMLNSSYFVTNRYLNYYQNSLLSKIAVLFNYLFAFLGERSIGIYYFFTPLLGAAIGYLISRVIKKYFPRFGVKKVLFTIVAFFILFEASTLAYLAIFSNPISKTITTENFRFEINRVYINDEKVRVLFAVPANRSPKTEVVKWSVNITKDNKVIQPETNEVTVVDFPKVSTPFTLSIDAVTVKSGNLTKEVPINKSIQIKKLSKT